MGWKAERSDPLIMGLDPGKVNFAFALWNGDGVGDHGDVEGADAIFFLPFFRKRILRKIRRYRPSAIFVERYHSRPGAGAVLNMELANLMIGIVFEQCANLHIYCELVTASTHKAWAARVLSLPERNGKKRGPIEKRYDLTSHPDYVHLPTEHEVDAANLARYGYDKLHGGDK